MPKAPPKAPKTTTAKPIDAPATPLTTSPEETQPTKPNSKKPAASKPAANGDGKKPAATAPKETKPKPKAKPIKREVIYDKLDVRKCIGEKALTVDASKKLLGWSKPPEGVKDGIFVVGEHKVWLTNNSKNRPIRQGELRTLTQEHLNGNWQLNGETIIIGNTGSVLSGQHTLLALILAEEERAKNPEKYAHIWKGPITMEKLVVVGVSEEDRVVNTIDTGTPRDLADVIFRSEYFADLKPKDRKPIAAMTKYAVKLLRHRTGANMDSLAPRITHAESLDFLDRHPRLLKAIRHIHEENLNEGGGDAKLTPYLSLGYSSAMLYLMAAAKTERERAETKDGYCEVDQPSEAQIDFSLWDKACEFFVLLASNHPSVAPVKQAVATLLERGTPTPNERIALIVKAWNAWSNGKKIVPELLALRYARNEDGAEILDETPIVGGIDMGNP